MKVRRTTAMAYDGEHFGYLADGTEVRRMTAEEADGRERRFCIVGHSHWNPASFFVYQAAALEREAGMHREAAALIEGVPAIAPTDAPVTDICKRDASGHAVTPSGAKIETLRSRLAGWHFSQEALTRGEREILHVAEQLLDELDRIGGGYFQ